MNLLFRLRMFAYAGLCLVVISGLDSITARAAQSYADFAQNLVSNMPADISIRNDLEDLLLSKANEYRAGKRARALRKINDGPLLLAARAHALDLLQQNAMGHRSSNGNDFESRMRSLHPGVMFMSRLAENAARERSKGPADAAKAERLFQQWIKSGSHRRTLVSRDYVRVATGVVQKGNVIYAVQIFAAPEVKSNMFTNTPHPEQEQGALY